MYLKNIQIFGISFLKETFEILINFKKLMERLRTVINKKDKSVRVLVYARSKLYFFVVNILNITTCYVAYLAFVHSCYL